MDSQHILSIKITNDINHQRIDNFIRKKFQKITKNTLYKMLRTGYIKINSKKIKPYYKIQTGDIVSYTKKLELKKNKNLILNNIIKKKFYSYILFEDRDLLIINKPTGIAVHGGSGVKFGIIEIFRSLKENYRILELIHRIDRNTSGILMLSKKKSVLKNIHQQFQEKKVYKSYTAIVHGVLKINKQHISIPLSKKKLQNGQKIITTDPFGKEALSIFKIKKRFDKNTLVEIIPKTGRTHQIRVHAAYIGHPIVFDNIYGNNLLDRKINFKKKNKKILLHASKITFHHPRNYKKYYIYAPIANRFIEFFQNR
ncbi:Ribosomal large subunit pseudouridine synthase C [Buchnera aphidicola (Takecallis arundicolens)]|uniref:RluA family pseudouridine synthase n=1 Tax=Buchnera aphidicola TaxID=9 RepID=UPI0034644FBC